MSLMSLNEDKEDFRKYSVGFFTLELRFWRFIPSFVRSFSLPSDLRKDFGNEVEFL